MRSILRARRHDVRIGRVDAVDVGVDLAGIGVERGRDRDAGGVAAAAAERRDVALLVDALEPGDHRDLAGGERVLDRLAVDRHDPRARERAVRHDLALVAEERARLAAGGADRERDEADRDLLAGRDDHVDLAVVRILLELAGELEQAVGLARHRGHDDRDLVALALRREAARRDVLHAVDGPDRGPAVFLDDQHGGSRSTMPARCLSWSCFRRFPSSGKGR